MFVFREKFFQKLGPEREVIRFWGVVPVTQ